MDLEYTDKIYEEYAEILALKIFNHLDKSSPVTLDDIRKKIYIKQNKPPLNTYNWHEATCINELLQFKNKELKNILSNNSRSKTGNKKILAMRVWNITHPETPEYKPKKLQDISGSCKFSHHIDDSSESDNDEIDSSDDGSSNIEDALIHSSKILVDQEQYRFIPKKNWIFKEFSHYYKFMGILKEGSIQVCGIPNELKQYYLQEQY